MWVHVVNAGRCWLEVDGDEPRQLQPGDFALVPHGEGHRLLSEPGTPAPRVDGLEYDYASDRYAILRYGGGGAPDEHRVRHRPLRAPGSPAIRRPASPHDRHRGVARVAVARGRLDAQHAQADRRRRAGTAPGRRGRDRTAVGHRGHPGHPRRGSPATRRGNPAGCGALQDPRIGWAMSLVHRVRPSPGRSLPWRGRPPCRGRRSPPGSPSWSASR